MNIYIFIKYAKYMLYFNKDIFKIGNKINVYRSFVLRINKKIKGMCKTFLNPHRNRD